MRFPGEYKKYYRRKSEHKKEGDGRKTNGCFVVSYRDRGNCWDSGSNQERDAICTDR